MAPNWPFGVLLCTVICYTAEREGKCCMSESKILASLEANCTYSVGAQLSCASNYRCIGLVRGGESSVVFKNQSVRLHLTCRIEESITKAIVFEQLLSHVRAHCLDLCRQSQFSGDFACVVVDEHLSIDSARLFIDQLLKSEIPSNAQQIVCAETQ